MPTLNPLFDKVRTIAPRMRLPVVQSIVRLIKADTVKDYVAAVGAAFAGAGAHAARPTPLAGR
jgi:hypothetical protein